MTLIEAGEVPCPSTQMLSGLLDSIKPKAAYHDARIGTDSRTALRIFDPPLEVAQVYTGIDIQTLYTDHQLYFTSRWIDNVTGPREGYKDELNHSAYVESPGPPLNGLSYPANNYAAGVDVAACNTLTHTNYVQILALARRSAPTLANGGYKFAVHVDVYRWSEKTGKPLLDEDRYLPIPGRSRGNCTLLHRQQVRTAHWVSNMNADIVTAAIHQALNNSLGFSVSSAQVNNVQRTQSAKPQTEYAEVLKMFREEI